GSAALRHAALLHSREQEVLLLGMMATVGEIAEEVQRFFEKLAGKRLSGPGGANLFFQGVQNGLDGAGFLAENLGWVHDVPFDFIVMVPPEKVGDSSHRTVELFYARTGLDWDSGVLCLVRDPCRVGQRCDLNRSSCTRERAVRQPGCRL